MVANSEPRVNFRASIWVDEVQTEKISWKFLSCPHSTLLLNCYGCDYLWLNDSWYQCDM